MIAPLCQIARASRRALRPRSPWISPNPGEIEAGVRAMADDVWAWCEKHQVFGQTVTVKIKYADFRIVTRSRTLQAPVDTRDQLHEVSISLVQSVYPVSMGIRLLGVSVSKFGEAAPNQLDLGLF